MASRGAHKRLTKEFQAIQKNPPPYIVAHPSEANILEWHYVLTGPPDTPYEHGQYWGTLVFPPDYPFAPPAIRMHTPSGRFQPSTRLCLSISDFHPKSYNPTWAVSTILLGLQSFMNSEEMTTGSVSATPAERRIFAHQTRWWNSTGGGSTPKTIPGVSSPAGSGVNANGFGNVKAGDGGEKFRKEWPELDEENWRWMKEKRIDPRSGRVVPEPGAAAAGAASSCAPGANALRRRAGSTGNGGSAGSAANFGAVGQHAREAGQSWVRSHRFMVGLAVFVSYVMLARLLRDV